MKELLLSSATRQAQAISTKECSALELCNAYLERIAAYDAKLGSYLFVAADAARAQAAATDERVSRGEELGPLAGVPIALKDLLVTKDLPTTAASKILEGWIPPYDGTAVAKLKQAGATILGKLNLDEFAMGSSNENSAVGPCKNPWDLARVPGGSSGGSAAAVAASLCAASLGTDTGGSIRQPASFCGTVGVKPSYGRVSRYGVIAFASSLDQIGPLTRTVEDAALLLEVICGQDPLDATTIEAPVPRFRDDLGKSIKGLRIGLPKEFFDQAIDTEVAGAVEQALQQLRALGADTVEVSLPHTELALPVYYLIAPAEASSNLARYDGVRFGKRAPASSLAELYERSRSDGFGPEVKRRIMLGTFALRSGYYDAYYRKAAQVRALIQNDFARAFEGVDLIASPTSPTAAFELGARTQDPMDMYRADIFTLSCNLAGTPGISVPCGFTSDSLPVGLQLIGPHLAEQSLLQTAHALEAALKLDTRRPELQS